MKQNNDSTTLWVLIMFCILLAYIAYGKHKANERLLNICESQHQVIEDLKQSIAVQNFYIEQLENHYNSIYNSIELKNNDLKRID